MELERSGCYKGDVLSTTGYTGFHGVKLKLGETTVAMKAIKALTQGFTERPNMAAPQGYAGSTFKQGGEHGCYESDVFTTGFTGFHGVRLILGKHGSCKSGKS